MNRPTVEIKSRLREALETRNMTQQELSTKTKIPKSSISQYLSGYAKPKSDRIYDMSRALDINETWLLGYDVPMNRSVSEHTDSNWQPAIFSKDEKDIKKKLDALLNQLTNETGLMYDGEPMDEESLDAVRAALEVAERTAMLKARSKFTPNKYKK